MTVAEIIISITLIAVIIHLFAFNRYINRKLDKLEKALILETI